jgi:signal transduction histidine kinase/HPt (histidine-containing phosphotransfer) domain-containing protein/ActR/RegA family two-component response regulator
MGARMALATAPIIILLWVGIGAFLAQKHTSDLDNANQTTRNLTHAFEENIRRTVEAIDTTIRAARVARMRDPTRFDLLEWERDSGLTRELTLQLAIADRTGEIVLSNLQGPKAVKATIADREHFRIPRDTPGDDLFISRPVLGRVSHRWSVQFVRKLYDADGAFDGVIVASLDPAFLSRFYKSLDVGQGALLLLGRDGIVRSSAPEAVAGLSSDLSGTAIMTGSLSAQHGTVRLNETPDGIDRIFSWRRVDPYGLVAAVGLSTADTLEEYRQDLHGCIAIGAGLTLVTLFISAVLGRHRRDVMQSREMLRAAVDNISQGLMVVDAQRCVPVMNERAAELLELPPHLTDPGVGFDALLQWQMAEGEFAGDEATGVRQLVASGGIESGTSVYRRTRGNGTVLEIRTKVVETGLAVRTFTDITEQEHAARDLAAARDAAEAAARARSEFLAVMSHEIRTPLNGVIGVAGLLEDMELGQAQRDYVRVIRESGDHLLELINDILDFSRLEAERVELEDVVFDPRAMMQGVVGMFLTQAQRKGLQLTAVADETVPPAVRGDPARLRQVLLNLVGNAVKFTDSGWIALTMAHEAADGDRVRLMFSVADSGIGIIPEAVDRMFQEFTQMDGSISRRFGGSGLGLAICRRLVELMGGTIAVESDPGEGSMFRFDVALRRAVQEIKRQPDTVARAEPLDAPLRVLLAEDNPTNRLVATALLQRLGHRIDTACNGAEALAALERGTYDLVLMDVMMPEMDGLAATRRIRGREPAGRHLPIVGLTAGSGADTLAECLAAGMDVVTTKPVTLPRLRAAIAEGLAATASIAATSSIGAIEPPPRSRLEELADLLGEDAVAELLDTFSEDTRLNIAAMEEAASRGDTRTVHRTAHSVAGAANNVGADALAAKASNLENNIGSLTPAAIGEAIAVMRAAFETAMVTLDRRQAVCQ